VGRPSDVDRAVDGVDLQIAAGETLAMKRSFGNGRCPAVTVRLPRAPLR